jgi:hypothetical protein
MAELNDSAGSPFANVYFVCVDSDQQNALVKNIIAHYNPITNAWVGEYVGGPKKGESW